MRGLLDSHVGYYRRQIEGYRGLEATLLYLFPEIRFRKYKIYYREYEDGEKSVSLSPSNETKTREQNQSSIPVGKHELPRLEQGERGNGAGKAKKIKWRRLTVDASATSAFASSSTEHSSALPRWELFAERTAEVQVCYEHEAEARLLKRTVADIDYRYGKINVEAVERTGGALPRIDRKRVGDAPRNSGVDCGDVRESFREKNNADDLPQEAASKSNVIKQGFRLRRVRKTTIDQSLFGDSRRVTIPAITGHTNVGVSMISGSVQHRLVPQGGYGALLPR